MTSLAPADQGDLFSGEQRYQSGRQQPTAAGTAHHGLTITDADGSQREVQSVEQRSQGNSSDGMRVAQQSLEVSRPDAGGRESQRTVNIQDASGRLKDTIVVDFEEKK